MKLSDKTVLIIDDDIEFAKIVQKILENVGMSVTIQPSITNALTFLSSALPDIIILDINMPEYNGFTFLKARKNIARLSAIPVVLVSNNAKDEELADGMALNATTYIEKPIEAKILIQKIKQIFMTWNNYVYRPHHKTIKLTAVIEGQITASSDECFIIESPVKFPENSFANIYSESLQEDYVGECMQRINFNTGAEFKYYFKLHGISEKQRKIIHDWRLKNIGK